MSSSAPQANTPAAPQSSQPNAQRPWWPWALGASLAVLVVLAGMFGGRALYTSANVPQAVPGPAHPGLPIRASRYLGNVRLLTADQTRLAFLTSSETAQQPSDCPPVGSCPTLPTPDTLAVISAQGNVGEAQQGWEYDLGRLPELQKASLLLSDTTRHLLYTISPPYIGTFSSVKNEEQDYELSLPDNVSGPLVGGTLTQQGQRMLLVAGNRVVLIAPNERPTIDSLEVDVIASRQFAGGATALDGPVLSGDGSRFFVLATTSAQTELLLYDSATLALLATAAVPDGSRLATTAPTGDAAYLLGKDGSTALARFAAPPAGTASWPLEAVPTLTGALAFGVNSRLGHQYVVTADGLYSYDIKTGTVLAFTPIHALWPASQPLLVDTTYGLIYVPTDHGYLAILRDAPADAPMDPNAAPTSPLVAQVPTALSAVTLARQALPHFLPDTNQDPPFINANMFPLDTGSIQWPASRPQTYWIHFSDLGWQSYQGTATTAVTAQSGGQYTVTFGITWNQLFQRQHTWTLLVQSDGSVQLQSDQGDALP